MNPKNVKIIGYKEKGSFIVKIDKMAGEQGLNRSNFLRSIVRAHLRAEADAVYAKYKQRGV